MKRKSDNNALGAIEIQARQFDFVNENGDKIQELFGDGNKYQHIHLLLAVFDQKIQPFGLDKYKAVDCEISGAYAEKALERFPETNISLNHGKNVGCWNIVGKPSKIVDLDGGKRGLDAYGTIWKKNFSDDEIVACQYDLQNSSLGGSVETFPTDYEVNATKTLYMNKYLLSGGAMVNGSIVSPAEMMTLGTAEILARSANGIIIPIDMMELVERAPEILAKAMKEAGIEGYGMEILGMTTKEIIFCCGCKEGIKILDYPYELSYMDGELRAELGDPITEEKYEILNAECVSGPDSELMAKVLTAKERNAIPDSLFALVINVKNKKTGKERKIRMFPLPDETHVHDAKSYLGHKDVQNTLSKLGVSKDTILQKIEEREKELGMKKEIKIIKGAGKKDHEIQAKLQLTDDQLRRSLMEEIQEVPGFEKPDKDSGMYWEYYLGPVIFADDGMSVVVMKENKNYRFPFTLDADNNVILTTYVECEMQYTDVGEPIPIPADTDENEVQSLKNKKHKGGDDEMKPEEILAIMKPLLDPLVTQVGELAARVDKIAPITPEKLEVTQEVAELRAAMLSEIKPFSSDMERAGWIVRCKELSKDDFDKELKARREIQAMETKPADAEAEEAAKKEAEAKAAKDKEGEGEVAAIGAGTGGDGKGLKLGSDPYAGFSL